MKMTKIIKKRTIHVLFFLITTIYLGISQPSLNGCDIDRFFTSPLFSSPCEGGDWLGFLHKSCCGSTFGDYLYALGQRANKTGHIFLNSAQQKSCLASISSSQEEIFSCGIDKLTSGSGGCSDFSVINVTNSLGDILRNLNENCELVKSEGKWEQSCSSCVKSWEEIGTILESTSLNEDMCRFAALVSFTSRNIEDRDHIRSVYRCLGNQKSSSDNLTPKHTKTNRIDVEELSIWIPIGGLLGLGAMIMIASRIMSKRNKKLSFSPKNDVLKNVISKECGCRKMTIKEVYSATHNLSESNFIGEGITGKVYKGLLSNNQPVAVKHIMKEENIETFVREVTSLSHIRHPNLVALMGCCVRKNECFLIYELCPNGNLSEWLFGKDKVLLWIQRLEIAIDIAQGLWFLHTYPEGCIVHRDIKPTNILLGKNFEAKLSDFGLSKVIDVGKTWAQSEVRGTFGYVDPHYQNNNRVKSSGDVYSFGVVLLQIISGKKVSNMNLIKPMPLSKMAKALDRGGNITEFADPKLHGEYSTEAFYLTLQLALSCTALKRRRPPMEHIVMKLEEAIELSTRLMASTPETIWK